MYRFRKILFILIILLSIPVTVYLALKIANFFGKASGVTANLVIDTGSSYSVPGGVWRNLGQGGEEQSRMLPPAIEKIKALRPEYIRIDHVFDYYKIVNRDSSGNLSFNWSELDLTLGDIAAMGAKPFISISYMPPQISKGDIVDLPNSWSDWELSVQRLVEHISGKGGLNISGVYYEVWNEPDLFGKFKMGGEKSYTNLYLRTVAGANRATGVNRFKIGGPATTGLYENWFKGLLKMAQSGTRLDFLSWHTYSKDLDKFETDYLNAKKWLTEFPGFEETELIISEIGPNSENDSAYDNYFGAIHLLATSALLEGNIGRTFIFEIKDGPGKDKLWGRWGLLTHEKFGLPEAKPRYSAIAFLNRMQGNKVNVAGQGSWIKAFAKENKGTIRTFVVNYSQRGSHYEAVPMTFINLPSQNFSFKRIDYGGGISEIKVATTSASWSTLQEFKSNSAAIFEITPN